jgi:hypothetical protein
MSATDFTTVHPELRHRSTVLLVPKDVAPPVPPGAVRAQELAAVGADAPAAASPPPEQSYAEPSLAVNQSDLSKLASTLPAAPASILDGLPEPIRIEDIQYAIFKHIFQGIANVANDLGYGWVAGVNSNFVGGDYVYVDPGKTIQGSGGYTITGPAFAPNLKQGPSPDPGAGSGYDSDLRTSIEFFDVSVQQMSNTEGDGTFTDGTPDRITTFTVDNTASVAPTSSVFTTEVFTQSQVGAATSRSWSDDWHFDVSSTQTVSAGGKGAMFPSVSLSFTEGYGQSHSTSGSTSSSNSLTDGVTETHSFSHSTPAGYLGQYSIIASSGMASVPFATDSVLVFGVKIHGFLRWGGGKPFQGGTNYHIVYSGSGDRPVFDYVIGGKGQPFWQDLQDQVNHNSAPWAWTAMFGQLAGSESRVKGLMADAESVVKLPIRGVMASIKRDNVAFKTISEVEPTPS